MISTLAAKVKDKVPMILQLENIIVNRKENDTAETKLMTFFCSKKLQPVLLIIEGAAYTPVWKGPPTVCGTWKVLVMGYCPQASPWAARCNATAEDEQAVSTEMAGPEKQRGIWSFVVRLLKINGSSPSSHQQALMDDSRVYGGPKFCGAFVQMFKQNIFECQSKN